MMSKFIQYGKHVLSVDSEPQALLFEQNVFNYERHVYEWLAKQPKPSVFLDIGSNYGHYLMVAKELWGDETLIWMVEPNARLQQRILRTLAANSFENVRLLPFAAGSRWGRVHCNGGVDWENGNVFCVTSDGLNEGMTVQQMAPLDDIVPRADIIKMDVEGFEGEVMLGMRRLLANRPKIVFEFCPQICDRSGLTPEGLLRRFLDLGYMLEVLPYHPGMGGVFTDPAKLMAYIGQTSKWICDLVAR